jgi:hypothetical protein
MSEQNTAWLLAGWALWIQQGGGVNLRARSAMTAFATLQKKQSSATFTNISHDEALCIDRAMAQLKRFNPEWERVLWLTFRFDYSDRRIAAYCQCSRRTAARLYMDAYTWMDNYLAAQKNVALVQKKIAIPEPTGLYF